MNLIEILRARIAALPEGDYLLGLKAVLQHVEAAANHLKRGQETADDSAFTDTIYRTNQAFEGSLKEAYRVLADKDPNKTRPYDIENYFSEQNSLRPRVLAQFTTYRTEWRNPSAHDYRLNFDEDEALLAIVTVSAFAIVLIDQILERLSYNKEKAATKTPPVSSKGPVVDRIAKLIESFTVQFNETNADRSDVREVEILGALEGYLSSAAPDLTTLSEAKISESSGRADMLVVSPDGKVIIELKRAHGEIGRRRREGLHQLASFMAMSGIKQAILFTYVSPNKGKILRAEHQVEGINGRVIDITAE